ncbi:MAG TPA: hypothetical protein VGR84_15535 [Candidatus Acidoferrales bacterium]|nr:hypothetical protein [Candidatus Acidoferrales bacterium]
MSNLLERVDFEHIEAERDPNLIHYFLQTESFLRIFRGEKMFVIGRKGTGKSTIYSAIEASADSSTPVAGLTFDDYPWALHNLVRDETKSADSTNTITWRYIILIELAKLLIEDARQSGTSDDKMAELQRFVESAYGTPAPGLKHLLTSLFDRLRHIRKLELPKFDHTGFSAGAIEFEETKPQEKAILDSIRATTESIQDTVLALLSDKLYFVLFDKLDDGWDNSPFFKSSMIGLLRAARDLNIEANRKGKSLRCVVFLRSDIYDCLQYNDKNKAFSDIEFLTWTDSSLQQLINRRIAKSLDLPSEENAWNSVFPTDPMRQGLSNFRYIMRRTLLRPRDLIAFCKHCKDTALLDHQETIDNRDIYTAEATYSERIYREFLDEMHKQYPIVDRLFEVLRRLRNERFTYRKFEKEFESTGIVEMDPQAAIRTLFEYSIVGTFRIGGRAGGSTLEFKYSDPLIQLDLSRDIVVHPALKKHLKLVEMRARKGRTGE